MVPRTVAQSSANSRLRAAGSPKISAAMAWTASETARSPYAPLLVALARRGRPTTALQPRRTGCRCTGRTGHPAQRRLVGCRQGPLSRGPAGRRCGVKRAARPPQIQVRACAESSSAARPATRPANSPRPTASASSRPRRLWSAPSAASSTATNWSPPSRIPPAMPSTTLRRTLREIGHGDRACGRRTERRDSMRMIDR